ncbi:DNA cytosine methyltransferase [Streptomyces scabiei]|uniref:DNA cytosine methyltransferase n=1 Tax=Streptomyces scabiei TaxID=1930 RepID=UPI0029A65B3F|nr:DNA cytosine methyltransferase [Streptomyces scabiei]MDX3519878.1 DNA cytosine methyltransferase [Streptomyces scabiei]
MIPDGIVELFRGPGGWAEGLRLLGLADVGLEWDTAACRTAHAAGHATIQTDVASYPTAPFTGRTTGLIASPPCQAWSRAGKRGGLADQPLVQQAVHDLAHGRDTRAALLPRCRDERSLLAAEPMRWLADLRPQWVCLEEVPDVLPLWRQYALYLQQWGYSTWTGVLNAADYGVPQTRKRAILIASRVRAVTAPAPTHAKAPELDLFGECLEPWVSMADALGWTDGLTVNTRGQRKTPGGNEFPADGPSWALTEKTRSWVLHTNRNQLPDGSRQTADPYTGPAPTFTVKAGGQWVLRHNSQKNATVRPATEPAGTLFFGHHCNNVSWENEQAESVRITVAEAAVLQSFRPDYPFQGTKTKQFEQIGNAVPPLLAAHIVSMPTGIPVRSTMRAAA